MSNGPRFIACGGGKYAVKLDDRFIGRIFKRLRAAAYNRGPSTAGMG